MNVYNIVWADDEIDALKDHYEERFNDNDIRIIGWAHDGKELEERISELRHIIDAVIVDANFNYSKISPDTRIDERNVTGLDYAHSLYVHKLNRSVPFFLFTQRTDELLHAKLDDKPEFKEDFKRHKNWFKKNDDDELHEMFMAIKEFVDYRKTDSFRIRNNYAREFEAAKLIEDAERNLEKGLLYQYNEDWKDVQDFFTPARKIFERIVDKLKEQKKLPPISKLNAMGKLLVNGKYEDDECSYELRQEVMPAPLAHSLQFFLDITQDGSHDNGDLKLGVDSYIRTSHNTNLFNSILFITMDLLLWHMDYSKDNNAEEIWSGGPKFEYTGKACLSPDGRYWYTGEYELMKDKDLTDGVSIGVKWGLDNTKPKTGIKKFVPRKGYVIIKD